MTIHQQAEASQSTALTTLPIFEDGAAVIVPDAHLLFTGAYRKAGPDLLIEGGGQRALIPDYFASPTPAPLFTPDGAMLAGDTVRALAGVGSPWVVAQAGGGIGGAAEIGTVRALVGAATVQRGGSTSALAPGQTVFQGDVVETAAGSSLGILLRDNTVFSLTGGSRMVMTSLVYDPARTDNTMSLNLVQGAFVFVTGQVAKTGSVSINTPVATMGIRGTTPIVRLSAVDGSGEFSLAVDPPEAGGALGSYTLTSPTGSYPTQSLASTDIVIRIQTGAGPVDQANKTPAEQQADALLAGALNELYRSLGLPVPGAPQPQPLPGDEPRRGQEGDLTIRAAALGEDAGAGGQRTGEVVLAFERFTELLNDLLNNTALRDSGLFTLRIAGQEFRLLPPVDTGPGFSLDLNGPGPGSNFATSFTEDGSGTFVTGGTAIGLPGGQSISTVEVILQGPTTTLLDNLLVGGIGYTAPVGGSGFLPNGIAYTVAFGSVIVTLTAGTSAGTPSDFQAALQSIQFINTSQNPDTTPRTVDITVTLSNGEQATAQTTVGVIAVNDAPVAQPLSVTVDEDGSASGQLVATDVDSANLSYEIAEAPAHGIVELNSDGSFTYTPNANFNGTDSFTFVAGDGSATSAPATIEVAVRSVNDGPVAVDDVFETNEDTPLSVTGGVLDNDQDVDGNALTASLIEGPAHGTLDFQSDGSFIYTPNPNFNGTDTFTYQASDGASDSNIATVRITVNPVDDQPIAVTDSYSVAEDGTLQSGGNVATLAANDTPSGDGGNIWSLLTQAAHGTAVVNADGSFSYTPNADFFGVDTFRYQITDADGDISIEAVDVRVTPVNDRPVADDESDSTAEDTVLDRPANAGVLIGDLDVDGDTLGVTQFTVAGDSTTYFVGIEPGIATIEGVGEIAIGADGHYSFSPVDNFNGAVPVITYIVSDGTLTDTGTLTLNVTAVNDAPINTVPGEQSVEDQFSSLFFQSDIYTNNAITVFDLEAGAASDIEVTISVGGGRLTLATIAGLSFIAGDGTNDTTMTFRGTQAEINTALDGLRYQALTGGFTDTLTIITSDLGASGAGGALTDTDTVSIVVGGGNSAPVAEGDNWVADEDVAFGPDAAGGLLANDVDADNDDLIVTQFTVAGDTTIYTVGALPGIATIAGVATLQIFADGAFSITPVANFNGQVPLVTYTVSDGNGGFDTAVLGIDYRPVADAPTAENDTGTTNEDTQLSTPALTGVLSNDFDVDGAGTVLTVTQFTVAGVSGVFAAGATAVIGAVGALTINADGSYVFNPAADFNGAVPVATYTVRDPSLLTDTGTLSLTVDPVNDAPVIDFAPPANHVLTANNGDTGSPSPSQPYHNVTLPDLDIATESKVTVEMWLKDSSTAVNVPFGFFQYDLIVVQNPGQDAFIGFNTGQGEILGVQIPGLSGNWHHIAAVFADGNVANSKLYVDGVLQTLTQFGTPNNFFANITDFPVIGGFTVHPQYSLDGSVDEVRIWRGELSQSDIQNGMNGTISGPQPGLVASYSFENVTDGAGGVTDTSGNGNHGTLVSWTAAGNIVTDGGRVFDQSTGEDEALTFSGATGNAITVSDIDSANLTVSLTVGHGTLTLSTHNGLTVTGDGTGAVTLSGATGDINTALDGLVYLGSANFNGRDALVVTASDGALSDNRSINISVIPVDDLPIAIGENFEWPEDGGTLSETVATNDTPSGDGDNEWALTTTTSFGTLVFNDDGTFEYTPNADFNGTDSFVYRVTDADGDFSTAQADIFVDPRPDAPRFTTNTFLTGPRGLSMEGISEIGGVFQPAELTEVAPALYQLTPATPQVAGALWGEIDLRRSFTMITEINLGSNTNGADGIAFVLQALGKTPLTFLESVDGDGYRAGGSHGVGDIGSTPGSGIPNAFGFWTDTFVNGTATEVDENSISFFQNSAGGMTGLPGGASPEEIDIPLENGRWHTLSISWLADDGDLDTFGTLSYTLTVYDAIGGPSETVSGSQLFDPTVFEGDQVYFGFVGSTGSAFSRQLIRFADAWQSFEPVDGAGPIVLTEGQDAAGFPLFGRLATSGQLAFVDPDAGNTHTVSLVGAEVFAQDVVLSDTQMDEIEEAFTIVDPAAGTWDFRLPQPSYLPEGSIVDVTYMVRVTDNTGRFDETTVTIRINGTNANPVLDLNGASTSAVGWLHNSPDNTANADMRDPSRVVSAGAEVIGGGLNIGDVTAVVGERLRIGSGVAGTADVDAARDAGDFVTYSFRTDGDLLPGAHVSGLQYIRASDTGGYEFEVTIRKVGEPTETTLHSGVVPEFGGATENIAIDTSDFGLEADTDYEVRVYFFNSGNVGIWDDFRLDITDASRDAGATFVAGGTEVPITGRYPVLAFPEVEDTTIRDADSTAIATAEIQIVNVQTGDVLFVGADGGMPAGFSLVALGGGHYRIEVDVGSGSLADFETALERIVFFNGETAPVAGQRIINVTLIDADGAKSNTAISLIDVVANNALQAANDTATVQSDAHDSVMVSETASDNLLANDTNATGVTFVVDALGNEVPAGTASIAYGLYGYLEFSFVGFYTYTPYDSAHRPGDPSDALINLGDATRATLTSNEAAYDALPLQDVFQYQATDGSGNLVTATLVVDVKPSLKSVDAIDDTATVPASRALPTLGYVFGNDTFFESSDGSPRITEIGRGDYAPGQMYDATYEFPIGFPFGAYELVGLYGTLFMDQSGNYDYRLDQTNPLVANLAPGETLTDQFTYTVEWARGQDTAALTFTIEGSRAVADTFGLMEGIRPPGPFASPNNDPPFNNVLLEQGTFINTALVFSTANGNRITVADTDAALGILEVTLTGTNGVITLGDTSGLASQGGNGTANVTMTGTLLAINTALEGLSFAPTAGFTGTASLTMTTNDQGNTGAGGPQIDSDVITIEVGSQGNVLANDTGLTNVSRITNQFGGFVDVDADGESLAGTWGTLRIASDGTYRYTPNEEAVNGLGTLFFTQVTDAFTYTADAGGASSQGTIEITIGGVNDPIRATPQTWLPFYSGAVGTQVLQAPFQAGFLLNAGEDPDSFNEDVVPGSLPAFVTVPNPSGPGAYQIGLFSNGFNDDLFVTSITPLSAPSLGFGQVLPVTVNFRLATSDMPAIQVPTSVSFNIIGNALPVGVNDTAQLVEAARLSDTMTDPGIPSISGNVLTNDTDADSGQPTETKTVSAVFGSPGLVGVEFQVGFLFGGGFGTGTVVINANGSYTATMDNASMEFLRETQTATTTVFYTVQDSLGGTGTASLEIRIDGRNDAPDTVDDVFHVGALDIDELLYAPDLNGSPLGVSINDSDVDNLDGIQRLDISHPGSGNILTTNGTFQSIDGTYGRLFIDISGDYFYSMYEADPAITGLAAGDTLTDHFEYTRFDGALATDTANFDIVIHGAVRTIAVANETGLAREAGGFFNATGGVEGAGNVLANDTGAGLRVVAVFLDVDGTFHNPYLNFADGHNVGTAIDGFYGTFIIGANGDYRYIVDDNNYYIESLRTGQFVDGDVMHYIVEDQWGQRSVGSIDMRIDGTNDFARPQPGTFALEREGAGDSIFGDSGIDLDDFDRGVDPDSQPNSTQLSVVPGSITIEATGLTTSAGTELPTDFEIAYSYNASNAQLFINQQQFEFLQKAFAGAATFGEGSGTPDVLEVTITYLMTDGTLVDPGNPSLGTRNVENTITLLIQGDSDYVSVANVADGLDQLVGSAIGIVDFDHPNMAFNRTYAFSVDNDDFGLVATDILTNLDNTLNRIDITDLIRGNVIGGASGNWRDFIRAEYDSANDEVNVFVDPDGTGPTGGTYGEFQIAKVTGTDSYGGGGSLNFGDTIAVVFDQGQPAERVTIGA